MAARFGSVVDVDFGTGEVSQEFLSGTFSPDGMWLTVGGFHGTVLVFQVKRASLSTSPKFEPHPQLTISSAKNFSGRLLQSTAISYLSFKPSSVPLHIAESGKALSSKVLAASGPSSNVLLVVSSKGEHAVVHLHSGTAIGGASDFSDPATTMGAHNRGALGRSTDDIKMVAPELNQLFCAAWFGEGYFVGGKDGIPKFYHIGANSQPRILATLGDGVPDSSGTLVTGHTNSVQSLRVVHLSDATTLVVTGGWDRSVLFWHLPHLSRMAGATGVSVFKPVTMTSLLFGPYLCGDGLEILRVEMVAGKTNTVKLLILTAATVDEEPLSLWEVKIDLETEIGESQKIGTIPLYPSDIASVGQVNGEPHASNLFCSRMSPNSKYVAVGGTSYFAIWEVDALIRIARASKKDGAAAIVGTFQRRSPTNPVPLCWSDLAVFQCDWSADSTMVVAVGAKGMVRICSLTP